MRGFKVGIITCSIVIVISLSSRIVPFKANPIPYLVASVDEGHKVPGKPYRIIYNDGGGMHSGNFWTYLVKDSAVFSSVIVQGYQTSDVRYGKSPIPVRNVHGYLEIGFADSRRSGNLKWIRLP